MGNSCENESKKEPETNLSKVKRSNTMVRKEDLLNKLIGEEERKESMKERHLPKQKEIPFESKMSKNAKKTYESLEKFKFPIEDQLALEKMPAFDEFNIPDGSIYIGQWKYKDRWGRGRQIWPDGSFYVGLWFADKPHGKGRQIFPNGDYFEDGIPNGSGFFKYFGTGSQYTGDVWNGKFHGRGIEIFKDGSEFEGLYEHNKKNGLGHFRWADGSEYNGTMFNNNIYGRGTFSWKDGRRYVGTFKNNKMEGQGEFYWPDGTVYVGGYHNDEKNGFGELRLPNGKKVKGNWEKGKLFGRTIYVDELGIETVQEYPEENVEYEKEIRED